MIRFGMVNEPPDFAQKARIPGTAWLQQNPGAKRPYDYWSPFRNVLADGFHNLCAYSAMYTPSGTVDHFVSWDESKATTYEWSNYRFAAGWLNSSKQNLLSNQLIDPFHVDPDWFEILLPSLQLIATTKVPLTELNKVEFMLNRLRLGHDERILKQRRMWYQLYESGDLSLAGLEKLAPLIANAVKRRDFLST